MASGKTETPFEKNMRHAKSLAERLQRYSGDPVQRMMQMWDDGYRVGSISLRPPDGSVSRQDYFAILSMLYKRRTLMDRWHAWGRPGHWVHRARRELTAQAPEFLANLFDPKLVDAVVTPMATGCKRELCLIYCRTAPDLPAFFTRKNTWRTYRHPGAIGLYVWIGDVQHHFRIEKV